MTARRALLWVVGVSTVLRLVWAACLGVGNDESYYFLFTLHPDWSYFDHPPMTAVVEALGLWLTGCMEDPTGWGLRLGFVGLGAGSTWLMGRLAGRFYGDWAGVWAAVGLNATAYFGAAAAVFALPDGPLVFFWLLALERLAAVVMGKEVSRRGAEDAEKRREEKKEDEEVFRRGEEGRRREEEREPGERLRGWVWVGLAWGGALLSKYHGVFLPVGAFFYLVVEPMGRGWLRRPGPWLALGVASVVFAPVVGWNAAHGWVSFVFQGSRAVGGSGFRWDYLLGGLAGPVVYLMPWVAVALGVSVWRVVRKGKAMGAAERFLVVPMVVPVGVFLVVACGRPVLPHWSLVGLLPGFAFLGRDWARRWEREPGRMRIRLIVWSAMPVVVAGLVLVQMWTGVLQRGGWGLGVLAVSRDPTSDLYGWDEVVEELDRRGLLDLPDTFVFTSKWYHSGQLAFALGDDSDPPVLCYSNRKSLGFGQWSRPEEWVGKDGILVVVNHSSTEPGAYEGWFERIEPLGEFSVERGGAEVKKVWVYRCVRQTKPFPYGGGMPERKGAESLAVAESRRVE